MSYATINDVFARYQPIKTMVGSEDIQVTSDVVSSVFIADAESIVNAYLSRRYVVPIIPVEPIITQIASDLSIFNMLVEKLPGTPDFFQPRHDRAINNLEMLRDGKMNLSSSTIISSGDQDAWSSTENYHPVFSPVLSQIDQRVDKDQVDSDKDDRIGDLI